MSRQLENNIFFSIVMPVYNGEKFIGKAIQSILTQSYTAVEIVIIDANSTDKTCEIINSFNDERIVYSKEQDYGLNHAVNKGLLKAKGKYILWLNSDDYLYVGALERVHSISKENDADVIYAGADHVDVNGNYLRRHATEPFHYKSLVNRVNFIATQACFFKRSVLSYIGLLDCSLIWCGDWDFWKRIASSNKFNFYYCDETLAAWRLHDDTITSRGGSTELFNRSLEVIRNARKYSTGFISSIEVKNIPYLLVGFFRLREVWRKLRKTNG